MNIDFNINKIWTLLSDKLEAWLVLFIKSLPNLAAALIVFFLFWALAKYASKLFTKLLTKITSHIALQNLASSMIYIAIFSLGMFITLGILNLDKAVTSILAGAGVIGLALGFAFQDIASNFISGIFIAFNKPYAMGDIIETGKYLGSVTSIDLRTTTLTTFQGLEVLVPNRLLFTEPLTNYTRTPMRRIDLQVGISYGDNLQKVEDLIVSDLDPLPNRIKHEEICVFFHKFGSSSINMTVQMWVKYSTHKQFLKTQSEAIKCIKDIFDENKITIPFPIRTLDFGIKGGKTLDPTMIHQELEDKS